jgi:hypothetical protein
VRCQYYGEFDVGGRTQAEDANIEWKEISNLYVPTQIRAKACRTYYGPNREECHGILSTEFTLQWLAINQPLTEARFDASYLTDSKKFLESIDPIKNNATSIIEVLEREKEEAKPRDNQ